jgi:4'-phosphopantetheinyl transferase
LGEAEIDLWIQRESDPLALACETLLSVDERSRVERLLVPAARRTTTISLGLRRRVLSAYTGIAASDQRFEVGEFGKPRLADRGGLAGGDIEFNVSHSGDVVVIAVARGPVGVDVERVDTSRDLLGMAATSFSPFEQRELARVAEAHRSEAFHRTWVQKEAFIKWCGLGLHYPLRAFDVAVDPVLPYGLVCTREPVPGVSQCVITSFDAIAAGILPECYVGALATLGRTARVSIMTR